MNKTRLALALMAAAGAAALPASAQIPRLPHFQLEPVCDGAKLRGLRGIIPSAGFITLYIPDDICAGSAPPAVAKPAI